MGFAGGDKTRPAPDAHAAHRKAGGELLSRGDASRVGREDVGVDLTGRPQHRGEQDQATDPAGVAPRLVPLGDDDVHPAFHHSPRLLRVSDQRHDDHPLRMGIGHHPGRVADAGDKDRHLHLQQHFNLGFEEVLVVVGAVAEVGRRLRRVGGLPTPS